MPEAISLQREKVYFSSSSWRWNEHIALRLMEGTHVEQTAPLMSEEAEKDGLGSHNPQRDPAHDLRISYKVLPPKSSTAPVSSSTLEPTLFTHRPLGSFIQSMAML
jgi:hypothetical protein